MTYDPRIHHRRSIRLKGYDYRRAGAYFVTCVAQNRECLFGQVNAEGEMVLATEGEIVAACWDDLPRHFGNIELDAFVIMPNHAHGLIVIHESAGAKHSLNFANASPLHGTSAGSLSAIVQNFKSVSTRKINQLRNTPGGRVWQRNYYERIIRNDDELTRTRTYIANNPRQWPLDGENPALSS